MENDRGGKLRSEEDKRTGQASNLSGKGEPREFEGMNFEQQRGSLKNSDYGGAIKNTRSGRNSSDVSQDELKD